MLSRAADQRSLQPDSVVAAAEAEDLTECLIWYGDLQDDPRLEQLLSPAEQRRAGSLRPGVHRQRFVTARAVLRAFLAERFGGTPDALVINTTCHVCGSGEHGRPELPGLGVSVSLSHSGDRVAVALAPKRVFPNGRESSIGLDIEVGQTRTTQATRELAEMILTDNERRVWEALSESTQERAMLTWWTRKESILKATGWGLAIAPNLLEVTAPLDRPVAIRWTSEAVRLLGVIPDVQLCELQPGPNDSFVGSLASIGNRVEIIQRKADRVLEAILA